MSENIDITKPDQDVPGVEIDIRKVDRTYGWLILAGALLSLTGAGLIFFVIFLIVAYGSGGKEGIQESDTLRNRLQDYYGVRIGEYGRWALTMLTVGWSQKVSISKVWSKDGSHQWDKVDAILRDGKVVLVSAHQEGTVTTFSDLPRA